MLDSDEEKAACLLNGRIVIHRGLLDSLNSDAELASVIGHEVCFHYIYNLSHSISFNFILIYRSIISYLFIYFSVRLGMLRVDIEQKLDRGFPIQPYLGSIPSPMTN